MDVEVFMCVRANQLVVLNWYSTTISATIYYGLNDSARMLVWWPFLMSAAFFFIFYEELDGSAMHTLATELEVCTLLVHPDNERFKTFFLCCLWYHSIFALSTPTFCYILLV